MVAVAVILLVLFVRVRLLEVPLERDEGEYAYTAPLILQGIPPFRLAANMKLPGLAGSDCQSRPRSRTIGMQYQDSYHP